MRSRRHRSSRRPSTPARSLAAGALLALTSSVGCGPKVTYFGSSGAFPERPDECAYRVLSGWSARPYFVIGRFDLAAFHRGRLPRSEGALRRALGNRVCAAGGDAVVAHPDTTGRYVQAIVVVFVQLPETADPSPRSEVDPPE